MILCSFGGLYLSGKNLIHWKNDADETTKQIEIIEEKVEIKEIEVSDSQEIIEQDFPVSAPDPYWDYIKMNLIEVNFAELKTINEDTKGWIQVNGTNVNYPFVQSSDNDFYLTHTFDKSWNDAGWVFLDYRNRIENMHQNTIFYAHARWDKSMFGSLKDIFKNGWLNNSDNFVIKLSTEKENTLWQVFSAYRIPTTNDYLQIDFTNQDDFIKFGTMLIKRSQYDFQTGIQKNDKIITLSTCYNDEEKVVIHAKLIKRELR